ncbi:MAG: GNAT family N-acetyltransferase [Pseudobdellovibrionaceae bacterium]|nr:GNAT family N-acetyltransferase [Bdellovibrionales bacterium]USN46532.1 MAG: GNAT family N-acetyltransferase [Pseudobdellovibrionaceae bacterium]
MEGPRAPKESELSDVIEFLDRYLRPQCEWSIRDEYPNSLCISNQSNIRVIMDGPKVISHAVVKYLIIKTKVGLFRVAAIGSVLTHPDYRSQGLSQKILKDCLQLAESQGCDFSILWTDLYEFYRRMDFELAGSEVSFLIDRELAAPFDTQIKVLNSPQVQPEALLKLYGAHTVTSMRNVNDIRQFLKIPDSRIYTAWNKDNQLLAYAVEGKGADLQGYIHEWGGGLKDLLPLLSHIYREQGRALTMIVPGHSTNLIKNMRDRGLSPIFGHLGMIRLMNTENVFTKLRRYAHSIGINDFVIGEDLESHSYYLGAGNNILRTKKITHLTQLLFGPLRASHIDAFQLETVRKLEQVLPIPMWIWGWDSV